MSIKKIFVAAAIACAVIAGGALGQDAQFPFSTTADHQYPHGVKPAGVTSAIAKAWYDKWVTQELNKTASTNGFMPMADENSVKVEGMGWALIAAAYMGDKESFDGMYRFYNWASKLSPNSGGMMSWRVDANGVFQKKDDNAGTAADGDLDVAFGLIVAAWQWGGNYLDSARAVITRCRVMVRDCQGVLGMAGGYNGGTWPDACIKPPNDDGTIDTGYTDISYYTPAFFRVFAEVSGDTAWSKLADDTYIHLTRNAHATTGIVSDWQNVVSGAPFPRGYVQESERWKDTTYGYDASRVPWRITLDYLWNGNDSAKAWATKISTWASGASNLSNGHLRNGTPASGAGNAEMAFLGGWAVAGMANTQAVADALGAKVKDRTDNYWYHRHTGNMYMLALSGNMWHIDQRAAGGGKKLNVTINGGGVVKRVPDKMRYDAGEPVQLTIIPNIGFAFKGWTGDVASGDANKTAITITIDADKSVTANLELDGGVNFVKNGDFSEDGPGGPGLDHWQFQKINNPDGSASVSNGEFTATLTNKGSPYNNYNLQLVQASLPLLKGNTYVISFDAKAAAPRVMEVMCQMENSPWTTYFTTDTPMDTVRLTTVMNTFTYEFTMEHEDDLASRIGFNFALDGDMPSVTISNVSVTFKKDPSSVYNKVSPKAFAKNAGLKVTAKRSAISVKFKAKGSGATELRIYGLKGNLLDKVRMNTVAGKSYAHTFNAARLPNGFYVVTLRSGGVIEQARIIMPK